ncbi:hypothetical protein RHS01_00031 [Rhizoctonia solani]|uniref:Uncharacterized protein n=1 Tax=Rhizoctonia solani TaxID=456999 RepID=A0A8H7M9F0_9AGAM|nr:hypothetical protein RHS01_00031 [Rhizoctonia solani]
MLRPSPCKSPNETPSLAIEARCSISLPLAAHHSTIRRPRISRSKVIAKLGEKRAAVASPRSSKTRSSIQGRTSFGVKPGPVPVDAAKARMRKSEAPAGAIALWTRAL